MSIDGVDFDKTWTTVKEIILRNFAGDPVEGVPSPSVQNTIYLSQRDILAAIKEVRINNSVLCLRADETASTNENLIWQWQNPVSDSNVQI